MSTAWMARVLVWREPCRAVAMRVVGRAIMPGILLWVGVAAPWLWLRAGAFVFALPGVFLWFLAIANVIKNQRALLVLMPTGSLERPQSFQEKWMKLPQEYAIGKTVTVTQEPSRFVSRAEPRVTLRADGTVSRIPLWGTTPEDFIVQANECIKGRGVSLVLVESDSDQEEKG